VKRTYGYLSMICLVVVLMLFGGGCLNSLGADIVHLMYNGHGQAYWDYMHDVAEKFHRQNPDVNVDIIICAHDKVYTMLGAGVPLDVVDLPDFGYLSLTGTLLDMMPFLKRDNLERNYNVEILNQTKAPNGGLYTLPFSIAPRHMIFNRDLFRARGVTAPDELRENWTWDAALAAGRKLTYDKDGDGVIDVYGIDRAMSMWQSATHQAGGKFYDSAYLPTKSLWTSEPVRKAVDFVGTIFRDGLCPHFRVGNYRLYMIYVGGSAMSFVDSSGTIGAYPGFRDYDFDFYLQPKGPVCRGAVSQPQGPHIIATTTDPALSWQWVKFWAADKENVKDWMRMTLRVPLLRELQRSYAEASGFADKNWMSIFEQSLDPNPYYYVFLPDTLDPRKISFDAVWRGTIAPEDHLEKVHQNATRAIEAWHDTLKKQ
jgi:ABC-type glycerol-3-phosphate transport system substrate-binding protein